MDIEVTHPFEVGGKPVAKITVSPIMFSELVQITSNVSDASTSVSASLLKSRISKQAAFLDGSGKTLKATSADIDAMPFPVAKAIREKLDDGQGEVGEIIGSGDGVSSPILYKLHTPLAMKSGDGDLKIEELEFSATTLMEAQEVLAEDSEIKKAHLLLSKLATPVGVKGLISIPAAAVDQVTVGDGVGIMRHVAPKF